MTRFAAAAFALAGAVTALLASPVQAQAGGGAALYSQRCAACHGAPGRAGPIAPDLAGVVGRKAGSTAFNYSAAMKTAGFVWDRAKLDAFLAGPAKVVPGTRMVFAVADAAQRRALVDYLATLRR